MHPTELPDFEATWWPVLMETVPGSGEKLAIAAIVRTPSGQSQVRQLIAPPTLASMFGSAGAGMKLIVVQTMLALQKQLEAGVVVEDLQPPFGGLSLGEPRDCVAHDVNEVFEVAFRLAGAFGSSQFGAAEVPSAETRRAFDEWAEKIRQELLLLTLSSDDGNSQWEAAFNVSMVLAGRKKTRFGFLKDGYAANFGVLRPGREVHGDFRALKIKLFDLETLRRSQPITLERTEIIVGYQDIAANSPFTRREIETLHDSWEFIASEARQRAVTLVKSATALDAATHLRKAVGHR